MNVPWYQQPDNAASLNDVRTLLTAAEPRVVVILGAALATQAGHRSGIARFVERHEPDPFPSWPELATRMVERLRGRAAYQDAQRQLKEFAAAQSAFDLTELFRAQIGMKGTIEFLCAQYAPGDPPLAHLQDHLPPAYEALVQLPMREIFTTNYDALFELAYRSFSPATAPDLRVSTVADYLAGGGMGSWRHLIKINGSIDDPASIVFTRTDVARAGAGRSALFAHLASQQQATAYFLVGYELADPNLALLCDQLCASGETVMPPVYVVQGEADSVAEEYLRALKLHPVVLGSWDHLADFLTRINTQTAVAALMQP